MAEYDNLLFKIDARRSEWSEDWKPVAESDVELLAQAAAALRALQTENTELRARAEIAEMTLSAHRMNGAASEAMAIRLRDAERVIHEARLLSDVFAIYEKLSSYPLGEGQTPKLDPRPWRCIACGGRSVHDQPQESHTTIFKPRPEYSQNRADYEGQTQQGDER